MEGNRRVTNIRQAIVSRSESVRITSHSVTASAATLQWESQCMAQHITSFNPFWKKCMLVPMALNLCRLSIK